MAEKLTDLIVKNLAAPSQGSRITYDADVKGFGCRVTAAGTKAFILNYRTRTGRERRITIGSFPDWKTATARQQAASLKRDVDGGGDPMAAVEADRNAKTMADLFDRFKTDHLAKNRQSTQVNYELLIKNYVLPTMRNVPVADVTYSDVDELHRRVTKSGRPYQANRTVAVLSKMFSLAIKWGWRIDNPARGIERNPEAKRERYLSPSELAKLTEALIEVDDQQGADVIRLLLLTGARSGEVMAARWDQFDLGAGVWTKPASTTKQKKTHRVPLNAPALRLLTDIHDKLEAAAKLQGNPVSVHVFPGRGSRHRTDVKKTWQKACAAAGLVIIGTTKPKKGGTRTVVKPSARIHDLRHTYASVLASAGLSLPIIGALLGHSQPATTARYSHLMDDPLRAAAEKAGAIVMPSGTGPSSGR